MKPLKMTMTAFGPYKNREVIDFAELDEHRLFVISGNTGAGKTTIFDAICFALYGEASGEERNDTRLMRSHFAEEDAHTSVELEFMLHERTYRVFRQMPHVKGGNKTATGGRYELYEIIEGEAIPCVDRFHVKDINEKIEQIIGLSKDQFSQIVMLPQGEFRKLLTSETENKEEILRRIFKTGLYKRFTERLKEKKQDAQKRYEHQAQERDLYIKQITGVLPEREGAPLFQVLAQEHFNVHQVVAALENEATHYAEETEKNREKQTEAAKEYQEKTAAYHRAQAINEKFDALDNKRQKKAEMDAEIPHIQKKQQQWERAEKASHLEVYERHLQDVRLEENEKKLALQNASAFEKATLVTLGSAQSAYEREEAEGENRDKITREIDRLKDFLPTVRDLDTKKTELDQLSASINQVTKEYETLEKELTNSKEQKKGLNEEVKRLEEGFEEYPQLVEQLEQLLEQHRVLKDVIQLHNKLVPLERTVNEKHRNYQTAQESYDELENRWFDGQAGVLAHHLHDGMPCPVCGSTEHPNKAVALEELPSKEELNKARNDKDQRQKDWMQANSDLENLRKQFAEKEKEARVLGFEGDHFQNHYDRVVEQGKQTRKKKDTLEENQKTVKKLKEQLGTVEKTIEEKTERMKSLQDTLQRKKANHQTQRALVQQTLEKIPEDLRSLNQLQKHLKETEQLKLRLENQWKEAQQQLQKAKEEAAAAKADVTNAEKLVSEVTDKTKKAMEQFGQALEKAGFSDETAYKQAKMPEDDRNALKQAIETFNRERSNLTAGIQELEQELEGQSRFDLDALFEEVKQLEDLRDRAQNALQSSQAYKDEANKLKQNITTAAEKAGEAELALQTVTDLYDVVRGDNPRKISFERYLQIEFLEQIVDSANNRLTSLSNGQFYLRRSDRLEKRGRQSGLGLDVYDAYTGQTRDVKSLSGGEKFNASLCLALGMADVIQAFEGGISIETMFIDEGFGSLDEESLNKAIDTLIDLQKSGRIVGVISHVQELKNAIPAVLEVQKTKAGHSQTRFVLR